MCHVLPQGCSPNPLKIRETFLLPAEAACANPCADFNVAQGGCKEFDTGSFECKDSCLVQVAACPDSAAEDSCEYSCEANAMSEWECKVFGADSYQCLAGCLIKITSCPVGDTGGN